jgi:hypothetical protein
MHTSLVISSIHAPLQLAVTKCARSWTVVEHSTEMSRFGDWWMLPMLGHFNKGMLSLFTCWNEYSQVNPDFQRQLSRH